MVWKPPRDFPQYSWLPTFMLEACIYYVAGFAIAHIFHMLSQLICNCFCSRFLDLRLQDTLPYSFPFLWRLYLLFIFLAKHQITQATQPPYSPDWVPCDFWLFPNLKSPLKGERFQSVDEIQENMTGQLMATGRPVWGPKVPTWKGTEASLSCV